MDMTNNKNSEAEALSDPGRPEDKEDGVCPEQNLIFKTKKQGCLPHFDFTAFQKIKGSKQCANMERSLVHTLGKVELINLLSAALLMQTRMNLAFTEICNAKEHNKICNAIQHVACDCVVTLCRIMDPLVVCGFGIQILELPGEVIAVVIHKLACDCESVTWDHVCELFFNAILDIFHGHPGKTLPEAIKNGNGGWDWTFGHFEKDHNFCDLCRLDLQPTIKEKLSSLVKFAKQKRPQQA